MRGHYSEVWQRIAAADGERPAIVTRERTTSFAQFATEAGALARHFSEAGMTAGDPLAILHHNCREYLVALFACFATGVVPVPVNYRYRAGEVEAILRDCEARMLLFPAALGRTVADAIAPLPAPPALLCIEDSEGVPLPEGAVRYRDVVARAGTLPATPPPDGELWLYTGGTTGRPKAVVWGVRDLLDVQTWSIYDAAGLAPAQSIADAVRIALDPATPRIVCLPLAPFMHGTALFSSLNALALGGTVLVHASPRLDPDEAVRLANERGATRVIVAGDAVALPLVQAAERAGVRLDTVTSVISSGMRLGDDVTRRLHRLGEMTVTDLLASTEGGPFAVKVTTAEGEVPGSLRLLPGAVVLDTSGEEAQDRPGAVGILAFRGTLPRGYLRDPDKTRETFPEVRGVRHVMPGDWARVCEDGSIELLGRGSSVVNTGGEKVYPAEVEEVLLAHAWVRDAVVFGMPDGRFGEVVTAVVVPEEGCVIEREVLVRHVDTHLAGYKKPRHLVVRASLERSPHGKVDLVRLKAAVARELGL